MPVAGCSPRDGNMKCKPNKVVVRVSMDPNNQNLLLLTFFFTCAWPGLAVNRVDYSVCVSVLMMAQFIIRRSGRHKTH